ncbi:YrvL family regulatory protein [Bacillus sp. X1(2014)]|uniref:YrvL family regulatory protein n=1 Tax=Bacillus sp. X1(2014) TaxID=1565991 RepID=UPI001C92F160|nr:YrvL family regulatory protein [Bacillus sp. X1(2014)]
MDLFEKVLVITALTLLVVISFTFVIGSIFFGIVGFFNLFGVRYTSPYSLIGFVMMLFLFGGVVDLFSITLIAWSSRYVSGKYKLFIIRMVIDCTFTWLALHTVDEYMDSITIPLKTEIIAVLLLFFIEIAFDNREKTKK